MGMYCNGMHGRLSTFLYVTTAVFEVVKGYSIVLNTTASTCIHTLFNATSIYFPFSLYFLSSFDFLLRRLPDLLDRRLDDALPQVKSPMCVPATHRQDACACKYRTCWCCAAAVVVEVQLSN